jgi:hypothetical protein
VLRNAGLALQDQACAALGQIAHNAVNGPEILQADLAALQRSAARASPLLGDRRQHSGKLHRSRCYRLNEGLSISTFRSYHSLTQLFPWGNSCFERRISRVTSFPTGRGKAEIAPAIYFERSFVAAGGLISYGPDFVEQYRQTAGYVDRILRGEKPADLPVQAPPRYVTVLNLKAAKVLGLEVPATVLVRADEVIE